MHIDIQVACQDIHVWATWHFAILGGSTKVADWKVPSVPLILDNAPEWGSMILGIPKMSLNFQQTSLNYLSSAWFVEKGHFPRTIISEITSAHYFGISPYIPVQWGRFDTGFMRGVDKIGSDGMTVFLEFADIREGMSPTVVICAKTTALRKKRGKKMKIGGCTWLHITS